MITEKLQTVFRKVFNNTTLEIKDEMTAKDIENWDSLAHISLILQVEKEFNIKLTTAEIAAMKNIGDLRRLIERKV